MRRVRHAFAFLAVSIVLCFAQHARAEVLIPLTVRDGNAALCSNLYLALKLDRVAPGAAGQSNPAVALLSALTSGDAATLRRLGADPAVVDPLLASWQRMGQLREAYAQRAVAGTRLVAFGAQGVRIFWIEARQSGPALVLNKSPTLLDALLAGSLAGAASGGRPCKWVDPAPSAGYSRYFVEAQREAITLAIPQSSLRKAPGALEPFLTRFFQAVQSKNLSAVTATISDPNGLVAKNSAGLWDLLAPVPPEKLAVIQGDGNSLVIFLDRPWAVGRLGMKVAGPQERPRIMSPFATDAVDDLLNLLSPLLARDGAAQ
jgi:hypothetical protein